MIYMRKGRFTLHKAKDNDNFDASMILKIAELVQAYCPPDRKLAYLECANRGSLSRCLACWADWVNDAGKTGGFD